MKSLLCALSLAVFFACSEKTQETQSDTYIPELVITDSLVIDHLTSLGMIDVKEDHSEFLFYDFKTSEFLRVANSGEILAKANRSEDGKDSYKQQYFTAANYSGENEILILTYTGAFIYDLDFNLKEERRLQFDLVTKRLGGSRALQTYKNFLYTFSLEKEDLKRVSESDTYSVAYPFITIRDIATMSILRSDYIPTENQMAINPGIYKNLDPIVKFSGDEMFVLFPNSPELYVYDFPELKLKRMLDLNPGNEYKQIKPSKEDSFEGFLNSLASSEYANFVFSNGYLLTQFDGFVPQEEVDKLPREYRGGPELIQLANKYK